ncbi:hypothetical protein [Komagataeibacter swingsii]|uniref:Uncharacterized protein n=1 Tax=Komagataeibacter swingsii TaxID=215220 RepID=A0A2V4RLF6_9PROT|nr:hypothetical protein [Komagataeibacter swingsii]PYD69804.1 hypothetical protein CFR76_08335 [Komagataeibacter swingsii]GBQ55319.1 hypothetical protein AA16373_0426 [Komagataeibacter swingsii DSM 16373]
MIDITRYVRGRLLALSAVMLLAGCHATSRADMSRLSAPAQDYLLITSYFMAEGGMVSRLQDGGLSGQQVYDMATSLKYGKSMILAALTKPSRKARRNGRLAVELMVACTNQPDPSTLGGRTPPSCLPNGPASPDAKGRMPPQPATSAHK